MVRPIHAQYRDNGHDFAPGRVPHRRRLQHVDPDFQLLHPVLLLLLQFGGIYLFWRPAIQHSGPACEHQSDSDLPRWQRRHFRS